jgi:hypothetical protein
VLDGAVGEGVVPDGVVPDAVLDAAVPGLLTVAEAVPGTGAASGSAPLSQPATATTAISAAQAQRALANLDRPELGAAEQSACRSPSHSVMWRPPFD